MFFLKCNLNLHCRILCVEINKNFYSNFQIPLSKCTHLKLETLYFYSFFANSLTISCKIVSYISL